MDWLVDEVTTRNVNEAARLRWCDRVKKDVRLSNTKVFGVGQGCAAKR